MIYFSLTCSEGDRLSQEKQHIKVSSSKIASKSFLETKHVQILLDGKQKEIPITIPSNKSSILSEGVEKIRQRCKPLKKTDDAKILQFLNANFTFDAIITMNDLNTPMALYFIEKLTNSSNFITIFYFPELSNAFYITITDIRIKDHDIPTLDHAGKYIDFLYCVYSYMLFS